MVWVHYGGYHNIFWSGHLFVDYNINVSDDWGPFPPELYMYKYIIIAPWNFGSASTSNQSWKLVVWYIITNHIPATTKLPNRKDGCSFGTHSLCPSFTSSLLPDVYKNLLFNYTILVANLLKQWMWNSANVHWSGIALIIWSHRLGRYTCSKHTS